MSFSEPLGPTRLTHKVDPLELMSPTLRRKGIFTGRFGIRAGWSMAVYAVLSLLFSVILIVTALAVAGKLRQAVADMSAASHASTAATSQPIPEVGSFDTFMSRILNFGGFVLAAFVLARIEHRRFSSYGIGVARFSDFLPGAWWGLATLSLLVAILRVTHHLVFDAQSLHGSAVLLSGGKWLLAFLAVGLFEEYSCRGFFQFTLTRGFLGLGERISPRNARAVAFSLAAFVMSFLFSVGHLFNVRENRMGLVMVFLAAVLFSYSLWRTGSLWWAIGFHMAWDWAQSFLFGVPDSGQMCLGRLFHTHSVGHPLLSGGVDGPEGSVYVIPIMMLAALAVRFTTSPGVQPFLQTEELSEPLRPPRS